MAETTARTVLAWALNRLCGSHIDSYDEEIIKGWTSDIAALLAERDRPTPTDWQPIETAPKDGTVIIGALITNGRVWRVHDMRHNGLAFYTLNGGSLPQMTHWTSMLASAPAAQSATPTKDGDA